jgi:hypothetical protein
MEEKEIKAKARKPRAKKESSTAVKKAIPTNDIPVSKEIKPLISDIEVAKKLINIFQSAQDRKLQFNLSFEYVRKMLEYKTCYYTGKLFTEDGPHARSFDRVDSDKGYVEGNVVACTIDINGKKSNLSFEEISCLYHKLVSKKEKTVKKEEPKKVEKFPSTEDFFTIEDHKE